MSEFFEVLKFARDSTRKWTQVIRASERYSQTTAFFKCRGLRSENSWKWFSFRWWPSLKSVEESAKEDPENGLSDANLKLHRKRPGLICLRDERQDVRISKSLEKTLKSLNGQVRRATT